MSKRINELSFNTTITLRDYFGGLAMQSLYLSGVEWETTGKERDEGSLAAIKELACDAYQLADAMLEVRGAEGRKTHCINYDEIEQLLAQPEHIPDVGNMVTQEPVYWENEKKALLNEIDHLTNRLAQPEQEPVAWIYDRSYGEDGLFVECVTTDYWEIDDHQQELGICSNIRPLYASPPKREQIKRSVLTEAEISKTLKLSRRSTEWDYGFEAGVGFAEEFHGIGETE